MTQMAATAGAWDGEWTAAGVAAAISARAVSAVEATSVALARIEESNAALTAFVIVDAEGALAQAAVVDARIAQGEQLPLAGVPIGIKDQQDVRGLRTAHGSALHAEDPPAAADDPHVTRLRDAGAVIVGKTATAEFGMDSATCTPAFGVTRNAWNLERTPGGSSGGSAAAVAGGLVPIATGSDGGGSLRAPASFSGLVGHKTTHALVGRPVPDDLSTLGGLTTTVADTRLLLGVMAGPTPGDRASQRCPIPLDAIPTTGLRAAIATDLGYAPVEPEVAAIVAAAAEALVDAAGLRVVATDVTLPNAYRGWVRAECMLLAGALIDAGAWPDARDLLHATTVRAVEIGLQAGPVDLARAVAERIEVTRQAAALFTEADVLLLPAVACEAFGAADPIPDVIDGRDATDTGAEPFTMFTNWTWQPAVSVPAGRTSGGLPVGLQIVGRRGEDALVLALAERLEQIAPWPRTVRR